MPDVGDRCTVHTLLASNQITILIRVVCLALIVVFCASTNLYCASSLDIDLSTLPPAVAGNDGDSDMAAARFIDAVAKKFRPEGAGVLSAVMRLRDCGKPIVAATRLRPAVIVLP